MSFTTYRDAVEWHARIRVAQIRRGERPLDQQANDIFDTHVNERAAQMLKQPRKTLRQKEIEIARAFAPR